MIRVLIVEDDPMVAELNRRYLARVQGFVLIGSVRSAPEAFAVLEQHEVDLILLDIFLPRTSGLKFLGRIRKIGKDIDIIMVSAACDKQSIQKALKYGVVDYLIKPFEFQRFDSALTTYRERVKFLRQQEVVNQTELDQRILYKNQEVKVRRLPKGLDQNTLKVIWEKVCEKADDTFNAEEMALCVGISRVSMRKYLNFLTELEILNCESSFGSVGRPVYKYRCINSNNNLIIHYL
jgi:two-component system, CitB family, response regulator MalR